MVHWIPVPYLTLRLELLLGDVQNIKKQIFTSTWRALADDILFELRAGELRKNSVVLAECVWKCVGNGRRLVKETTGFLLTRTVRECYRGRSFNLGEIA